jgi:hypothetical protein
MIDERLARKEAAEANVSKTMVIDTTYCVNCHGNPDYNPDLPVVGHLGAKSLSNACIDCLKLTINNKVEQEAEKHDLQANN